jgi:hypothetical protein
MRQKSLTAQQLLDLITMAKTGGHDFFVDHTPNPQFPLVWSIESVGIKESSGQHGSLKTYELLMCSYITTRIIRRTDRKTPPFFGEYEKFSNPEMDERPMLLEGGVWKFGERKKKTRVAIA